MATRFRRYWLSLFVLVLVCLLVPLGAMAQDAAPATDEVPVYALPDPDTVVRNPTVVITPVDPMQYFTPVVVAGSLIILGLLYAYVNVTNTTIKELYKRLPPLAQTGIRLGLEELINRAATTPDPQDDAELARLAKELGYRLALVDGGRIILVSDDPDIPDLTVQRTSQ